MHALVTGVAGFIGSHLADGLVAAGWTVRGVDDLRPTYSVGQKRDNLRDLLIGGRFELIEADLSTVPLAPVLDGVDVVFHLAARPGVRSSWGHEFPAYLASNVVVTQRLLEGGAGMGLRRFVYASNSSVYGDGVPFPTPESALPAPVSPYGVTKLAAEHLCRAYASTGGLPTVSLRLFTVYGPRQRPDMAFSRLFEAALGGASFELLGGGEQVRDFTYVGDVVEAMVAAATVEGVTPGEVLNVAGGASTSLSDVIELVAKLSERDIEVRRHDAAPGDVLRTGADIARAETVLGWAPSIGLEDGLQRQLDWHRRRRLGG